MKARHFDSSWNWVRQDALLIFTMSFMDTLQPSTENRLFLLNCTDPELLICMQDYTDHCDAIAATHR